MSEIFSNQLNKLEFIISVNGEQTDPTALPTAELYTSNNRTFDGTATSLTVVLASVSEVGRYTAIVPQNLIYKKRYAKIVFKYTVTGGYGAVEQSSVYNVTQRLISFEDLNYQRGFDDTGESLAVAYYQYDNAEKTVRATVESFCGQEFTLWQGIRKVSGVKGFMYLPQHMEDLDEVIRLARTSSTLSAPTPDTNYNLSDDGMSIEYNDLNVRNRIFKDPQNYNFDYDVTGLWGYDGVPVAVERAALELVNSFLDDTMDDRRRFLAGHTTGQDSVFMNYLAFTNTTGNPNCDNLLAPYRLFIMGAV